MKRLAVTVLALAFALPCFAKAGHHSGGKGAAHKSGHHKHAKMHHHYAKK